MLWYAKKRISLTTSLNDPPNEKKLLEIIIEEREAYISNRGRTHLFKCIGHDWLLFLFISGRPNSNWTVSNIFTDHSDGYITRLESTS